MTKPSLCRTLLLATLATVTGPVLAADPTPAAVTQAITAARDTGTPFHLQVHSTGAHGFRSLDALPSGVAIWKNTLQVSLPPAVRTALLGTLLDGGFPALAPSYGGKPEAEDAALRVSRRVALELDGLRHSSVQLADGEQSKQLERLAEALLDLVAPLAADGVGAADLPDGLAKVATGTLATQVLRLRFVDLPPAGGASTGSILRLEDGVLSRQEYAPGRAVGEPHPVPLDHEGLEILVAALRAARLEELPVNLWADGQVELEVGVLQHRKTVVARPFSRLDPEARGEAQQRFESLLVALRALGAVPPPEGA
jgi:hypothetical protein